MRFARWTGRSDRVRSAFAMTAAIGWTLGVIALMVAARSDLAGLLGLVAIFAVPTGLFLVSRRRTVARLTALMTADTDEIAVRMTVRLDNPALILGADEGMLCEEDGWLIYRGFRTEWSVRTTDVSRRPHEAGFSFAGPDGRPRRVELESLVRSVDHKGRLGRWIAASVPAGEPVFPPAVLERRFGWWLEVGEIGLAMLFAFALGSGVAIWVAPHVGAAATIVGAGLGTVVARAAAYRRLARAQALPEGP